MEQYWRSVMVPPAGRTGPVMKEVDWSDDPATDMTIVDVGGDPCATSPGEAEHSEYDRNREVVQ
jgi:hypothetical protein